MSDAATSRLWSLFRYLLLLGVGLGLLSPLLLAEYQRRRGHDLSGAREAATGFLEDMRSKGNARRWLTPDVKADPLGSVFVLNPLLFEIVPGAARSHGPDMAFVPFTVRRAERRAVAGEWRPEDLSPDARKMLEDLQTALDGTRGDLELVRLPDGWRIKKINTPAIPAHLLPPPAPRRAPPEAVAWFEQVAAVDPAKLEAGWRVDYTARDLPARQVLWQLATAAGLKPMWPNESAEAGGDNRPYMPAFSDPVRKALDRRVSVEFRSRTRLEMLEQVADDVGLQLSYVGTQVTPTPPVGPRNRAVMAGPFSIALPAVQAAPTAEVGVIQLQAIALELPGTLPGLIAERADLLRLTEVRSADGADLLHADRLEMLPSPAPSQQAFTVLRPTLLLTAKVPLRNLLGGVDSLDRLRGEVRLPLPARVDLGGPIALAAGTAARVGPLTLRLTAAAPATRPGAASSTLLGVEVGGPPGHVVCWLAADAAGNPLAVGQLAGPLPGRTSLTVPAQARTLRVKVVHFQERVYPFELPAVKLLNRLPARLRALEHPGHPTPLTAGRTRLDGRQVAVELTNHSNKAVEAVRVRLRYLDAKGQPLGEFVGVCSGKGHWATVYGAPPPLARPGESAWGELSDPARPAQTARVEADVLRVLFADGGVWAPPD